jgi:hypothetical protein
VKQAQKPLVTLLAVAAAAASLGLYACSGGKEPEKAGTQRKEQSEKLFATDAPGEKTEAAGAAVAPVFTQLTVQAKGVTATLEFQDGTWRLTSPVSAKADKWTVDNILTQLQSGKFKAAIEEAPTDADLEKYGLKTPVFAVTA